MKPKLWHTKNFIIKFLVLANLKIWICTKKTEEAFWDPDWFEHIISNLVYEQEQEQEQEKENE